MWDVVVIGGGVAGLTAAYSLHREAARDGRELRVCLAEGECRPGGKVLTERLDGFLVEGGPDSFIVQKPWALELVRELGLEDRIMDAEPGHRKTYVVKSGRLVALPEDLRLLVPGRWAPVLRSPFLSWRAKLRMAWERRVPPRREQGDESVADFVRRRLGAEVLSGLAEPLLAHIHVADVERMSLWATYPRLAEMERRFGSLTAAMEQMGASRVASHDKAVTTDKGVASAKPAPVFLTLRGGMGELVERLTAHLPAGDVLLGRRVRRIVPVVSGDEYGVELDDGSVLETQAVVLAVPAWAAARLAEPVDAELARRFDAIRYVSTATLSLGYRRRDIDHPLEGYGFFVPRSELNAVIACTWTSSKFAGRSPDEEHVLVRLFLGGALDEAILDNDDETLVSLARRDLHRLLGIRAEPMLECLHRWPRGYPQYEVGHLERVRAIESALPPRWAIAGSPYHGVGLPDCIRSAREAASGVLDTLRDRVAEVDGGAVAC